MIAPQVGRFLYLEMFSVYCILVYMLPFGLIFLKGPISTYNFFFPFSFLLFDLQGMVVTIKPDIIIFGEMYSTDATLMFSRRYIKVEGSTVIGTRNSFISSFPVFDIVKIESCWYKEVSCSRYLLYYHIF